MYLSFFPGIQNHTSHHPLAYSEAARYDGRRKTTVGKTWKGDEKRRTPANINRKVEGRGFQSQRQVPVPPEAREELNAKDHIIKVS